MARLSMKQRKNLPKSDFAVPSKAPGPGSYPMPDEGHAKAAIGMAEMHGGPVSRVRAKAKKKFGFGHNDHDGDEGGGRRGHVPGKRR